MSHKTGSLTIIVLLILLALSVTAATYFYWNGLSNNSNKETAQNTTKSYPQVSPTEKFPQTEASQQGKFKVEFSYPSEGTPIVRLCFESVNDLAKQYCFLKSPGIGSSLKSGDTSSNFTNSGELPSGQYHAYIIVYWSDSPADILNLNACNYKGWDRGTHLEDKIYCTELDKQYEIRQQKYPNSGVYISAMERNAHFGGPRETFAINANKTTDLGTISVAPF